MNELKTRTKGSAAPEGHNEKGRSLSTPLKRYQPQIAPVRSKPVHF